jgi:hydroquinone glucosyltransferase
MKKVLVSMNYVFLLPVNLDDVPKGTMIEPIISLTVVPSLPSLRDALKSLIERTKVVALVVDLFSTDARRRG